MTKNACNKILKVALNEAKQLKALEDEALQFLLEEEKQEKQELHQALGMKTQRATPFNEVCVLYYHHGSLRDYKTLPVQRLLLRSERGRSVARCAR